MQKYIQEELDQKNKTEKIEKMYWKIFLVNALFILFVISIFFITYFNKEIILFILKSLLEIEVISPFLFILIYIHTYLGVCILSFIILIDIPGRIFKKEMEFNRLG